MGNIKFQAHINYTENPIHRGKRYPEVEIMKGLILCGGKGTRMRPFAYSVAKHLLPVANKPVIHYIIESMREAGIEDIYIVVGASEDGFTDKLGDGSQWGVSIKYIVQGRPLGLAHGVKICEDYLKNGPFVTVLGDNIINHSIGDIVKYHYDTGADSTVLLSRVENPERYGIATLDDGKIIKLVEKPKNSESSYAVVGMYVFNSKIFHAIERIKPSERGELELTDGIMEMIKRGDKVGCRLTKEWWIDAGSPEDLLRANKRMLGSIQKNLQGQRVYGSKIADRVVIGENSVIEDSVVDNYSIIGRNVVVKKSHIGPYTSIGDGSRLEEVNIRSSIVMEDCIIEGVPADICMSIIGRGSVINTKRDRKNINMWIGQDSIIKGI